jgi:hypothetical protein
MDSTIIDKAQLTVVALVTVSSLAYLAYRWALPKPIPGIPYDKTAAKHIFGSLPQIISYMKQNDGQVTAWLASHNDKHKAPLVQIWAEPFGKPTLLLTDFQESQDILIRRTREFDRAKRSLDGFTGFIPHSHISMKTADPRFKGNKELVRDLMSPSFLNNVKELSSNLMLTRVLIGYRSPRLKYTPKAWHLSISGQ